MANIFKKIKTIEEVLDVPTHDSSMEKHKPLGLKPILAKDDDDISSTTNIENSVSDDVDNDLRIPVEELTERNKSIDSKVEADHLSNQRTENRPNNEANSHTDKNGLNIHPVDMKSTPVEPETLSIETIETDSPTANKPTPNMSNITDRMPTILSDIPSVPLSIPSFSAPKWPYWMLVIIGFMWIIGSSAAAYGYFELGLDSLNANPIHALGFVGFILVPACLLLVTALMLRRMNQLSYESQKMAFINEQLLTPSDYAAKSATHLSSAITKQMDKIEQRAEQAVHRVQQLQTAFDKQITSVTQTLNQNAEQNGQLDAQLINSKIAWTQTIKDTDQTIADLSQSLDSVLSSFQTRIETTHQQFDSVKASMEEYNVDFDEALNKQEAKVKIISDRHDKIKQSSEDIRSKWQNDDDLFQDRIFNQLSQIDALSEQTEALVSKLQHSSQTLKSAANLSNKLPLRGSMAIEQLDLLPGLGEAKAILPTLLEAEAVTEAETPPPLDLDFEDIASTDMDDVLYSSPNVPQPSLSSQRIGVDTHNAPKKKWFKSFGKRQESPNPKKDNDNISIPPIPAPTKPLPSHNKNYVPLTLTDRLIREQLSPDVLIDSGCAREAARLRLHEGPFAMSQYVSIHLGAAVVHLRDLLPSNPALRTQVHDMAAVFPIREKLDIRDEEALVYIFSSQAGREYLLCEAAVNGSY
ncbi:MAG: hypothetical protein ABJ275_03035 [Maricaulaceae bacterium]